MGIHYPPRGALGPDGGQGLLRPRGSYLTANLTETTTTMQNMTGLTQHLVAGRKYAFEQVLFIAQTVVLDGAQIDFDGGTATATTFRAHSLMVTGGGAVTTPAGNAGTLGVSALATDSIWASTTTTTDGLIRTCGIIIVNAGGTFIPRFSMEAVSTGVLTVYAGSYLVMQELQ